jgi:hypothetical protein
MLGFGPPWVAGGSQMPTLPHDYADLLLAPTVVAVDARLSELALLDDAELVERIRLEAGTAAASPGAHAAALLATVASRIDLHGWSLAWDPRGVRLTHGVYRVVLGTPATFARYLAGGLLVTR